ncbi:MAG: hypothetical protein IKD79_08010 [Oscillospiraceae bacterium]|nr:hypothetical protein [Oscillospiraceae bacterium]
MKKRCFILLFIILSVLLASCGKPKEEVLFSRDLEEDTPVYASIAEIEPKYGWSDTRTGELRSLICESKTEDGTVVWLNIPAGTFNSAFPQARDTGVMGSIMGSVSIGNTKYFNQIDLEEPVLIHGTVEVWEEGKPEYDIPAGEHGVRVQSVDAPKSS